MKKLLRVLGLGILGIGVFIGLLLLVFLLVNRTNGKIVIQGETRRFLLYVPRSYDPSQPVPLVVTIHGYAQWPAHQAQISHWNSMAEKEGFIVVYPAGTGFPLHWRTSGRPDDPDSARDVQFLESLIEKLEEDFNIDPRRIYVNGLSNGAGMTYLLSCRLGEKIAAIGGVSGAYLVQEENCQTGRRMPMVVFHGTADEIVPYEGGPSRSFDYPFPNIPLWVEGQALKNGCSQQQHEGTEGDEILSWRYFDCRGGGDIDFYTIVNGGHAWPGGDPLPKWIAGYTTDSIDATGILWEFFEAHPLP